MLDRIREAVREILSGYGLLGDVVEEVPENAEVEQLILLTDPLCPACAELKKKIAYALEQGWIVELNANQGDGKRIADELGIAEVPALVAVLSDGRLVRCRFWFEGDDFVFDLDIPKKNDREVDFYEEPPKPETLLEEYDGDLAITCMDTILKAQLANILLGKYGDKFDDWWLQNVTPLLMSIPTCPSGNLIGYGKPRKKKKKRRKKSKVRRRPKVGIVKLCREAKEFLARYDERVKQLPECDLIYFAEVEEGEGVKIKTEYHEFLSKCMKEVSGSQKEKLKKCAEKWREMKAKTSR